MTSLPLTPASVGSLGITAVSVEPTVSEIVLQPSPVVGSSGALTNSAGVAINTFADSANSFAAWLVAIPDDWGTFDINVQHYVASSTGNVAVRADVGWLGDGDSSITVTNGLAAVFAVSTSLATQTVVAASPVTAGKLLSLRVLRTGSDSLDTFTGTWNVRAVRLVRAT